MRKSSVLLGIICVVCTVSAIALWWQLRTERAHVATLEQRLAALTDRPVAPVAVATSTSAQNAIASPVPASASRPAQSATSSTGRSKQQQEVFDLIRASAQHEREMMRDPAYRQAQMTVARRQFAHTRADALRVVGMTPEQADRVIDLWIERNFHYAELVDVPGEAPSEAAQAELKRAGDAEQAELRRLLGEQKYEEWNHYLASGSERAEVGVFRAELADSQELLRDNQADALVEALYSERQRLTHDYDEYAKSAGIVDRNIVSAQDRQRWLELAKEANQRIHDSMAATLSQSQLASLDERLKAKLAPSEAELRMQLEGRVAKTP
jgi:hypothetical protein